MKKTIASLAVIAIFSSCGEKKDRTTEDTFNDSTTITTPIVPHDTSGMLSDSNRTMRDTPYNR